MVTRCLFGIFVFGSNKSLIYRFTTDDLYAYLRKRFIDRGYRFDDELTENKKEENEEITLSFDDAVAQHFSILINVYSQTSYRHSSVKQIELESGVKIFFDQIGENNVICVADDSFNTVVVLKTINLFKSLVKFHMGALLFTSIGNSDPHLDASIKRQIVRLINGISASLQYFLNNVTINQALLFESCEYLHINSLIRQQCLEACTIINQDVQFWLHVPPTVVLITCKDKIVYMHLNHDQNRPSNSDLFLLLLNNTSRSLRNQFKSQQKTSSSMMTHIYKTKFDDNSNQIFTTAIEDIPLPHARRVHSLPTVSRLDLSKINENRRIEVVFMKTSNKLLAPFTLYTIPLTNEISALILVEWKNSLPCSLLSDLIRQLDLYTNHLQFPYARLNNLIKSVENNGTIRRFFETKKQLNILSKLLNEAQTFYRLLPKTSDIADENNQNGNRILTNLTNMRRSAIDAFHHLFFNSDEYVLATKDDEQQVNDDIITVPMIQILRNKLLVQLGDWFSFIEIKSQRNITMSFCHNEFSGLVHFVLIDRLRGRICTPALFNDEYQYHVTTNNNINGLEQFLERKILAFELECLSALQRGCTSYTMTDEHFTYNYTLRLQESNGASMRLYKPFVKSQSPGILHFDFYQALANENYSSLNDQTAIACFELICVHLRIVPSSSVREQCEKLWPRLMELDD